MTGPLIHNTSCILSRCVFCAIPVVSGAVWNPPLPPGDLAGTVHQSGGCQRVEDYLPFIWWYAYLITNDIDSLRLQSVMVSAAKVGETIIRDFEHNSYKMLRSRLDT